ncbi:MAG: HAMP domain-containing sensor histidine kinase [Patescibacteria group bacterium]|nr:HAMP domain-containing sensor histidine kinase [Patescibacteria group bacterium]
MKKIKLNLQWKLTLAFLGIVVLVIMIFGILANYYIHEHFQKFCELSGIAMLRCARGKAGQAFLASINRSLFLVGAFGAFFSIILGYVLGKFILSPLQKAIKAVKEFSEGNYAIRINAATSDEINDLIKTLNRMFFSLEKLEKLRKDLVANFSHELATPLTNIYGYLEAINDNVISDESEKKKAISLVKTEAERLIHLTKEMKKLALLESENFVLSLKKTDINSLIENICEKFILRIKDKNITIDKDFDLKLPKVEIDPAKFELVIFNLIDNAIKYSPNNGVIKLKTLKQSEQIIISIKDNGQGIDKEDIPFIFERFYRGDKSRTKKDDSSGIGLTIVKKIVEAHKGSIEIKSAKGKGSEFIIYLTC